jgi:hypothetical protein
MRTTDRIHLVLVGLGLLSVAAVLRHSIPAPPAPQVPVVLSPPVQPATPFGRSLQHAWHLRSRAILAEDREREALEERDPFGIAGSTSESIRREQLARDRDGAMRQARTAARQAATMAKTPAEEYRAAWLLAMVECDLGDHQAELQEARRLAALAPRDWQSQVALQHAEACDRRVQWAGRPGEGTMR